MESMRKKRISMGALPICIVAIANADCKVCRARSPILHPKRRVLDVDKMPSRGESTAVETRRMTPIRPIFRDGQGMARTRKAGESGS